MRNAVDHFNANVSREGAQTGLSREIFLGERVLARLGKAQLRDRSVARSGAHGVPALSGRPVRRMTITTVGFYRTNLRIFLLAILSVLSPRV